MSEWIRTAKVGDKVVAVGIFKSRDGRNISLQEQRALGANRPSVGMVYTIRSINDWGGDRILLLLSEIDNLHITGYRNSKMEPGWHYRGFRPVRKTDISVFTAMLDNVPAKVLEDF